MTHDELIRALLVERYAPRPKRAAVEDTEAAQQRRQAELLAAVKDYTATESTPEQRQAAKRARHLRRVA